MTADGPPSGYDLSAWHRRFPDHRLRPGRLRLWRIELAVRPASPPSLLSEWIARATADGLPAARRRLGLPAAVIAAPGPQPTRQTLAFLDLPTGVRRVTPPARAFDPWPEPVDAVPADVLRPSGVDWIPPSGDWRTVPVVRVEAVDVVAVWAGEGVRLFAADEPDGEALWELPADALPGT
jgi:hypothetical protein